MMWPEKICNDPRCPDTPKAKRYIKRQSVKAMRRAWKKLGEDAPRKLAHRGWSS